MAQLTHKELMYYRITLKCARKVFNFYRLV